MKKKIVWDAPKQAKPAGTYGSYSEFVAKAEKIRKAQATADELFAKAMPVMAKLLEFRLAGGEPLIVKRPLVYQTSDFAKSEKGMDAIDRAFYNNSRMEERSEDPGKFVDKRIQLAPGTQLMFKSIDAPMQEFIFEDQNGEEHAISFAEKKLLMTQTDIYEAAQSFLKTKGE